MDNLSNHLIHESSPYLLQHAHNPVEWYPWADEALRRAEREDKPILVSIGYSACHWCHVMERESFEDKGTAAIMNEHFINIKVDREERPDLDHIYMDAVQAMTGSGGWPMNVFLTPGRRPFYGGTYFPPRRAFNRPSWKEILLGIAGAFREKREEIEQQAGELTAYLAGSSNAAHFSTVEMTGAEESFSLPLATAIYEKIMEQADELEGGFGPAPKFPSTFLIRFLMRYFHATGERRALDQARLSLDKMISGGICDQAGGGFARYSTTRDWLVPHFEKMLYDNALLTETMSEAYQLTRHPGYAGAVRKTLGYVAREMSAPGGGFYSALDADSEGVEGKYYVWTRQEVEKVLGAEAALFCAFYDVTEGGNWEGKNILHVSKTAAGFAEERQAGDPATLEERLDAALQRLLSARETRTRPLLDDKILLGWNSLMVTAYCRAFASLGEPSYKKQAEESMAFLLQHFRKTEDGWEMYHNWKNGTGRHTAFLDDYAALIQALISLQEINARRDYLLQAKELADHVLEHFAGGEGENAFFYYTREGQEDLIVRKKELTDGAVPSGNAMMASALYYLSVVFDRKDYREMALRMNAQMLPALKQYPASFGAWAINICDQAAGCREIAVVGKDCMDFAGPLLSGFSPGAVWMFSEKNDERFPLLRGREKDGATLIYVCRDYTCQAPLSSVEAFRRESGRTG